MNDILHSILLIGDDICSETIENNFLENIDYNY